VEFPAAGSGLGLQSLDVSSADACSFLFSSPLGGIVIPSCGVHVGHWQWLFSDEECGTWTLSFLMLNFGFLEAILDTLLFNACSVWGFLILPSHVFSMCQTLFGSKTSRSCSSALNTVPRGQVNRLGANLFVLEVISTSLKEFFKFSSHGLSP
jgi:hypothetical protein